MARLELRRFFPPPLVGVTVLLLLLILLTPNLLPNARPSAGSIFTQAELVVDWDSAKNLTHVYVRGLGTVRYTEIHLGLSRAYNWSRAPPVANLSFIWQNQTAVIAAQGATGENPVAVNVSAVYTDPFGVQVVYGGLYAFYVLASTLNTRTFLSGEAAAPTTPLADLPVTLLLVPVPTGGP